MGDMVREFEHARAVEGERSALRCCDADDAAHGWTIGDLRGLRDGADDPLGVGRGLLDGDSEGRGTFPISIEFEPIRCLLDDVAAARGDSRDPAAIVRDFAFEGQIVAAVIGEAFERGAGGAFNVDGRPATEGDEGARVPGRGRASNRNDAHCRGFRA